MSVNCTEEMELTFVVGFAHDPDVHLRRTYTAPHPKYTYAELVAMSEQHLRNSLGSDIRIECRTENRWS